MYLRIPIHFEVEKSPVQKKSPVVLALIQQACMGDPCLMQLLGGSHWREAKPIPDISGALHVRERTETRSSGWNANIYIAPSFALLESWNINELPVY
jgi:hypothetical protein